MQNCLNKTNALKQVLKTSFKCSLFIIININNSFTSFTLLFISKIFMFIIAFIETIFKRFSSLLKVVIETIFTKFITLLKAISQTSLSKASKVASQASSISLFTSLSTWVKIVLKVALLESLRLLVFTSFTFSFITSRTFKKAH